MNRPGLDTSLGGSLVAVSLAPLVAHLIWRPAAVALGSPTQDIAFTVAWMAVVIAAIAALLVNWRLRGGRADVTWGAGLTVALGGGLLVGGSAGALCLLGVGLFVLGALPSMIGALERVAAALPTRPGGVMLGLWSLAMLACIGGVVDLATYLGDPDASQHGLAGGTRFYRHLCFTAYAHAAELLSSGTANVYDLTLAPGVNNSELPASAAHMAPFSLDRYGYPPQFLLLPTALGALIDDFMAQRAFWTCANALVFAWAIWRVAFWVGPRGGRVARWSAPFLWLLGGMTFQSGNVQFMILGLGVLAMISFHDRRERLGGTLLAAVTLSKIAPGLLGVVLLVQRRWRAVAWTVVAAVAISVVAWAVLGSEVFAAFFDYHLPRIASGEAYDFLDDTPELIRSNVGPFGLPFKFASLGLDWDPWVWGPRFATVYTVLAFGLTIYAGRRRLDRRGQAAIWMLVLTIAALRGPMSPAYLLGGIFWALSLAGAEARTAIAWVIGVSLLGCMLLATPFGPKSLWLALGAQAVMHGTIFWLMLRRWPALDADAS